MTHEMAHIRRHDYVTSVLQSVAEAVLFYHPAIWWISEEIRIERELCCDDLAVAVCGDVLIYARALADLESRQPLRVGSVLGANGGSLVNRIRRLIEPTEASGNKLPRPGAIWAMTILWAAGIGAAAVHAAQQPRLAPALATLVPFPASPQSGAGSQSNEVRSLVMHARRTLLYDPFLPAKLPLRVQLAQIRELAQAAASGSPQENTTGTPWLKWMNQDVAYIIADEERKAFRQLATDEERQQFMEQFWVRRDPTPGTVANEFKEEHYRRLAYANEHFASLIPGWKSDRGMIYVRFGPPDEIQSHLSDLSNPPTENWKYRFIEGVGSNVNIQFVDRKGTGEYFLTIDPLDREWLNGLANIGSGQVPNFTPQDLQAATTNPETNLVARTANNQLPFQVRVDYVRSTEYSTMTNITVQIENRDLQFQASDGTAKAMVNLFGRVTTMARRPVSTWEKPFEINVQTGAPQQELTQRRSLYQQTIPLSPGRYRVNLVAKDLISGKLANYEIALDVPDFIENTLSTSSLILGDSLELLPSRNAGGNMFAIGGMKVRPRPDASFSRSEKMGIYLQVYNFKPDDLTQMPSGSIQYEVDRAGSNEKVLDFAEDARNIANASADQATIGKQLPLSNFAPGAYVLKVRVTDRNRNQTVETVEQFHGEPELGFQAHVMQMTIRCCLKRFDNQPVSLVSCFYVRKGYRKHGITSNLIAAPLEYAKKAGAPAVEAYPPDADKTPSAPSTGFVTTLGNRRLQKQSCAACRLARSRGMI